jgi:arabinofuranosyltransferase
VVFGAVLLADGWSSDTWTRRARVVAALVALPLAYQVFRMGYFGTAVPGTALAKEAAQARWGAGWSYVRDTITHYELWIPLVVLGAVAYLPLVVGLFRSDRRRGVLVVAAFVTGGLLYAAYVVRVGGDYFQARLVLPSLIAWCAPVAVVPLRKAFAGVALIVPWAAYAALAPEAAGWRFDGSADLPVTAAARGWGPDGALVSFFSREAVYFHGKRLPARPAAGVRTPAIASYGIGISSYAIGPRLYTLDLLGLADPLTARLELERRGLPGHEKPLPAPWVVARLLEPGAAVGPEHFPTPFTMPRLIPAARSPAELTEQAAWARAALECPRLRELRASYEAPLTIGRFVSNLVDSIPNARLRIPPDPEDAYRRFCGPGVPPEVRAVRRAAPSP